MTGDRPIHLDLGMPSGNVFDVGQGTGQQAQADPRSDSKLADDAANLRALLQSQREVTAQREATAPMQLNPFDLLKPAAAMAQQAISPATVAAQSDMPAGIDQTLSQMAQRLLVGDGSSGRRAVQIQLSSDTLPGVVLDVFEDGGMVIAEFTCSHEDSRERLVRNAQWLADGMHQALARAICVRVQTDDPEDRCCTEANAGI